MKEIKNFISKLFHKENDRTFDILTYLDIDTKITKNSIIEYMNKAVENNPILKTEILEIKNNFYFNDLISFELNDYYRIEYDCKINFDNYTGKILNANYNTKSKFYFLWCIDEKENKTRLYFKVHHAYMDGYKIIDFLKKLFNSNVRDITKTFKRKTSLFDTIYYYTIGTIILTIANLKILTNAVLTYANSDKYIYNKKETHHITCKNLNLKTIQKFTKENNLTLNDFLYTLIIKADKFYRKKQKILLTCSPINVSSISETNNMCPVFNKIENSQNSKVLFKKVHDRFNLFKYSLFIPILAFIINYLTDYINMEKLSYLYNSILNNVDYVFSNVVGPDLKNPSIKVTDVHFLSIPKNKEIVYNIISSENNINIICTYKSGIIKNPKRFEKCIYLAYNELIQTSF